MLPAITILVIISSFVAGYWSRSYVGVVVPATMVLVSLRVRATDTAGPTPDETDVLPDILVVAAVIALGLWILGVHYGRRDLPDDSDDSHAQW